MNNEILEKANQIKEKIKFLETQIEKCENTLNENTYERDFYFSYFNQNNLGENKTEIKAPKQLFKTFAKMIVSDYQKELIDLKQEFEDL